MIFSLAFLGQAINDPDNRVSTLGDTKSIFSEGVNIMADKKQKTFKIGRDSRTGEFIKVDEAKRRPATTQVETIQKRSTKKK